MIVESIRQWCVLIGCSILIILLILATNRIYRTNRRISFDVVMIGAECLRVLMLLIYDFFFDHLIWLLSIFIITTILRAIVCSNFVSKVLLIKGFSSKVVIAFQAVYYFVILIVIVGIFILALSSNTAVTCNN